MPRKKHIPGEELFEDEAPVAPIDDEAPEEISVDTVAPEIEAPAPVAKVDVCSKCGATMNRIPLNGPEMFGIMLSCPCGQTRVL